MMFRRLETLSLVAPFGTRFMDSVLKTPITDGLHVTAYPNALPQRRLSVPHNGSGAFFLHEGPGLRQFQFGKGDDDYWGGITEKVPYTFEVVDRLGRFVPHLFTVDLPHRRLFTPSCLRTPANSNPPAGVPLYSTPARLLPPGTMVIRAQLWDRTAQRPAAFAVVEAIEGVVMGGVFTAKAGALPQRGISDENGGLAIILPVPQPDTLKPVKERLKWLFNLSAFYAPPAGGFPPIPDLCAVLAQNRSATLLSAAIPATALAPITLELGREVILKTSGPVEPTSWLHLVPN
jgi:hypothetical protein